MPVHSVMYVYYLNNQKGRIFGCRWLLGRRGFGVPRNGPCGWLRTGRERPGMAGSIEKVGFNQKGGERKAEGGRVTGLVGLASRHVCRLNIGVRLIKAKAVAFEGW